MDFQRVMLLFAAAGSINSVSAENREQDFSEWMEWLMQPPVTQMDSYLFHFQEAWISSSKRSFIFVQSIYSFFTDYIF